MEKMLTLAVFSLALAFGVTFTVVAPVAWAAASALTDVAAN
jgi:uncharacterized membrane protein